MQDRTQESPRDGAWDEPRGRRREPSPQDPRAWEQPPQAPRNAGRGRPRERRPHRAGRWAAKVVGRALALVLAIVLLPYASRLAALLLADVNTRGSMVSEVLYRHMEETALVDDEGRMTATVDALLVGTVQRVTIRYRYEASLGIDLSRVKVTAEGGTVTVALPPLEVLNDSLTPLQVDRQDFWYPLTEKRRSRLLQEELERCRAHYLAENSETETAWQHTLHVVDETFSAWIGAVAGDVRLRYVRLEDPETELIPLQGDPAGSAPAALPVPEA